MLLVDDHASFREPLAFMLDREPDLDVVAQSESLSEARMAVERDLGFDVAVVDLDLPDGSGTEFVGLLHGLRPEAMALVLSASSEQGPLAEAIEAGAAGVLHKSARLPAIVEAIRDLRAGKHLLSSQEIVESIRLVSRERREEREAKLLLGKLTPREIEVLQALAAGSSDKDISKKLFVSVGTVRTHVTSILAKLEVTSRLQALLFAVRHGVVTLDPSPPGSPDAE